MNNNDKTKEANLASFWKRKFEEAMIHKAPYVRKWNTYFEAYDGDKDEVDYIKNEAIDLYNKIVYPDKYFVTNAVCE